MRTTSRVSLLVAAAVVLLTANALAGGPASERALRSFDQNVMDAFAAKIGADPRGLPRIDGFVAERRVPLLLFTYYDGQSLMNGREISCASRHSVVVWYGLGATLIWQDGLWFPDRRAVHEGFAKGFPVSS